MQRISMLVVGTVLAVSTSLLWAEDAAMGADLYKAKCVACHGTDGKGETPAGKGLRARDFGSVDVQKQSDTDLGYTITKGRNKMPGFSGLSIDQVTSLVKYIRGMKK